ncbi:GET complex subunit get1 [Cladophialophora chaetospira]|uniref:GET complex subunit get1 n=1 Tax=Cladophialophora chaetospira TaxID=386627 RepID=A0AA38X5H4_9EURO|nr:GET complex subunit get1 [Cladophialophora chaetospira]
MPSLLITVFIIQLLCHLVQTVGAKPINDLLWQIYARLPLQSNKDQGEQIRLRREVVRLKREMNAVSAQDEFSKWARLRRQHDKAMEEYDKKAAAVSSTRSSFDTKATALRWTCTSGLRFALQFWHAKTPVFTYPRGWFPWYVEWLLGFPRCPYGGVSINVWSTACATVIALVGEVVLYLLVLTRTGGLKEKQGAGMQEKQKQKRKTSMPTAMPVD